MSRLHGLIVSVVCIFASATYASDNADVIRITHSGASPSTQGSTQRFSGQVRIDMMFQSSPPSRMSGGAITFEPGARTAWHTHPLGQTLIVTSGRGWIQQWDAEKQEMATGDIVSIPPGVKHWHGATPTTGMSHIALQEALDGTNVNWLEQVTDEQFSKLW